MKELKVTIFNVDQGLCVFARTPEGHGVMIDCGRTGEESAADAFSPVKHVLRHEVPSLVGWNGRSLTKLIVTHPHDDHVEDIDNLTSLLRPALLLRHKNYDWDAVLNPPDCDPSRNATTYFGWQRTYNIVPEVLPDYGLTLESFALTPAEAALINPDTQHALNNSSYVTVFTYQPPGYPDSWKVVVSGDNETAGWEALLRNNSFVKAVRGADFFVTSHHGHKSGFSEKLFAAMGLPLLNISSIRQRDAHVYDAYDQFARGATAFGGTRKHLTTRNDGHVTLHLQDNLKYYIEKF